VFGERRFTVRLPKSPLLGPQHTWNVTTTLNKIHDCSQAESAAAHYSRSTGIISSMRHLDSIIESEGEIQKRGTDNPPGRGCNGPNGTGVIAWPRDNVHPSCRRGLSIKKTLSYLVIGIHSVDARFTNQESTIFYDAFCLFLFSLLFGFILSICFFFGYRQQAHILRRFPISRLKRILRQARPTPLNINVFNLNVQFFRRGTDFYYTVLDFCHRMLSRLTSTPILLSSIFVVFWFFKSIRAFFYLYIYESNLHIPLVFLLTHYYIEYGTSFLFYHCENFARSSRSIVYLDLFSARVRDFLSDMIPYTCYFLTTELLTGLPLAITSQFCSTSWYWRSVTFSSLIYLVGLMNMDLTLPAYRSAVRNLTLYTNFAKGLSFLHFLSWFNYLFGGLASSCVDPQLLHVYRPQSHIDRSDLTLSQIYRRCFLVSIYVPLFLLGACYIPWYFFFFVLLLSIPLFIYVWKLNDHSAQLIILKRIYSESSSVVAAVVILISNYLVFFSPYLIIPIVILDVGYITFIKIRIYDFLIATRRSMIQSFPMMFYESFIYPFTITRTVCDEHVSIFRSRKVSYWSTVIAKLVLCASSFICSKTPQEVLIAVGHFIAHFKLHTIRLHSLVAQIRNHCIRSGFRPQSSPIFTHSVDGPATRFLGFKDNEVYQTFKRCLAHLIITFSSEQMLDDFQSRRLVQLFDLDKDLKCVSSQNFADFTTEACSLFDRFYEYGARIRAGQGATLLHNPSTYRTFLEDYNYIVETINSQQQGIHADTNFLCKLDDTIKLCSQLMISLNAKNPGFIRLRSELAQLREIKSRHLVNIALGEKRPMPFGILLQGAPGCGKSSLYEVIHKMFCKMYDLEVDSLYVRMQFDKFWNNWRSTNVTIVLDDLFSKEIMYDPENGFEFIDIINTVPFSPNQAAVEEKGKNFCVARLCIGTTNLSNRQFESQIKTVFQTSAAPLRRFPVRIAMHVKPEFQTNTGSLDLDLPFSADGAWDFEVYETAFIPSSNEPFNPKAIYRLVPNVKTLPDVLQYLARRFVQHERFGDSARVFNKNLEDVMNSALTRSHWVTPYQQQMSEPESPPFQGFGREFVSEKIDAYVQANPLRVFSSKSPFFFEVARLQGLFEDCVPQRRFVYNFFRYMDAAAVAGIAGVALTLLYQRCTRAESTSGDDVDDEEPELFNPYLRQGNIETRAPQPKEKEEENVWYNAADLVDPFPQNEIHTATTAGNLVSAIEGNTLLMRFKFLDGKQETGFINVLGLKDSLYVTTAHMFERRRFSIRLLRNGNEGVSSNSSFFDIEPENLYIDENRDLAWLNILHAPPVRDITKHFLDAPLPSPVQGKLFGRMKNASGFCHDVEGIRLARRRIGSRDMTVYVSEGVIGIDGWCGSPLLCQMPSGWGIAGIHCAYSESERRCAAYPILKSDIHEFDSSKVPVYASQSCLIAAPHAFDNLGPLHRKSTVRFVKDGSLTIFGSLPTRSTPKSSVRASHMASEAREFFKDSPYFGEGANRQKFVAPRLTGYEPWRVSLLACLDKPTLPGVAIAEAARHYFDEICARIESENVDTSTLVIMDRITSINGLPGVKFIDPIAKNKSAGFGRAGPKSRYLVKLTPEQVDAVNAELVGWCNHNYDEVHDFAPELMSEFNLLCETVEKRVRTSPTFVAHLKDEPIKEDPNRPGKPKKSPRVFSGCPLVYLVLARMYFLTLTRMIQLNPRIFECAAGTNCHSRAWQEMYNRLTSFSPHSIFAGDYEKFDKNFLAVLLAWIFWILIEIFMKFGKYHPNEAHFIRAAMWAVATDIIFAVTLYRGDLFMFWGTNPSGNPLTVIINSIGNSVYMRIAYLALRPPACLANFQDYVVLYTYGDDNISGVSLEAPWFNQATVSAVLGKYGIVYTDDTKSKELLPYRHISEVTFLKRSWLQHDSYPWISAPLSLDSIFKAMQVCVASKTLTPQQQFIAVMDSVNNEMFQHGPEAFKSTRAILQKLLQHPRLSPYVGNYKLKRYYELRKMVHGSDSQL